MVTLNTNTNNILKKYIKPISIVIEKQNPQKYKLMNQIE